MLVLYLQLWCVVSCYSTSERQFSSLWEVDQVLRKANIEPVNIWNESSGLHHADVTIGSLNISVQFPWPLNKSGSIQLPSNKNFPVPDIYDFAERFTKQVGVNGSLPSFQLVGVGNFGFAIDVFTLSFDDGNLSSIDMMFSIPGWDALNKFQFKVVEPKLIVQLGFLPQAFKVRAKGFIAAINQVASNLSIPGLPIEIDFPESPDDLLQISGADENAVVDFNSLVPLFSSHMDRNTLEAIGDISQSIKVPQLFLRVAPGLSNISIVNVTTISTKPFLVLGKVTIRNATLELTEPSNTFEATIEICGQQLSVTMLKDTKRFLTLDATRDAKHGNTSISIDSLLSCVEERKERRPDTAFMRMNVSSFEFRLYLLKINYSMRPKLTLASMVILIGIPTEWNVLDRASIPTKLLDSTLSLKVAVHPGSHFVEIKAEVLGTVVIGNPTFLEFPFVIEIPTKVEALSLSLQAGKTIQADLNSILKLGELSNVFPSFLKTLLTDFLVTKLKIQFPSSLTGSFLLTEFRVEIPPRTKWNFPFFYLGNMTVFYTFNRTRVTGEIMLGNFSLPCEIEWPPSIRGHIIELSRRIEMFGVLPFIKVVYRTFFGSASETLHETLTGLQRTKLSIVPGFSLEKTLFHLSSDLSLEKVTFIGALPKYSWELLDDFFGVENVSFLIELNVQGSFDMLIRGKIVLVEGSVHIPFEMAVPSSKQQNLTIRLPEQETPRVLFKQFTGILTRSKFPTMLGSYLPELILQRLQITFDEKLAAFEITEFGAVCSTSWDLGGIGALAISNVSAVMTPQLFRLRGFLLLGTTNMELELTNSSAGHLLRLVKPVNAFELERLVKDALQKMVPQLKSVPDASLLDLNAIGASLVKLAEVELSKNLGSLHSFALDLQISNSWSFFKSCCSLIAPTMSLRVKDLNDIPSYTFVITGNLELSDKEQRLVLPLECNIPDSLRSVIILKLKSAVTFNLSNIALLPMVGKLIPSGMLTPISDFIGNVRVWPLEAHFEPRSARMISLDLTATALRHWNLRGFPLTLQNITLDLNVRESFHAALFGMFVLKALPISFRIPYPPPLPHLIEMKIGFQSFPDLTLPELGQLLIGGFDLPNLFPPAFGMLQISLKFLNLELLPPLIKLQVQGFTLKFSLPHQVILIDNWLRIENITADLNVKTAAQVNVAGTLTCLITVGKGDNVIQAHGILTMPHHSSQAWKLHILSHEANQLSAANIVGLTGGGFDLKSLFPEKILSKADKFMLKTFKASFLPNPQFHIFNITCEFEVNLTDVWLPLGITIRHIRVNLFVTNPFDAGKQIVTPTIYVEIQLFKAVVPTVLSVYKDFVRLEIANLVHQPLSMYDLASLIGGDQLLKSVPDGFLNFKKVTLNSLNITFSKPQFRILNAKIRCDLKDFDVGFSFPLPMADLSNVFKARLGVQYLELGLKQNKDWELTAGIKASFTGIPLEEHFSDLQGLITVRPRLAIVTLKEKLLDTDADLKLAGLDCHLRIKFYDPNIVFSTPQEPELEISLDVSGFDTLNKLLPFKVFKDTLQMDVSFTKKTGLAIKLKTIPILDKLITCNKAEEEYICDFTWLCQKDSYVRLKLPSLAYTKDGFSAIIDVQGLDKLCIPLTLPIMRQFFKKIPFLSNLLKQNIPIWPPPDIIGALNRIGCNIDNLPSGMERFKSPEFPKEITIAFSVAENGPLTFSLQVQNDESVDVAIPVTPTGDLLAISLRRFTIGSAFGVPFVDINAEVYLWDLKFVILLSRLPKTNPLLINAEEMQTHIICKDCFFIIVGYWPIPIFAAPFSIKYATLIDVKAQATIYHRRPEFKDFSTIASLLVGLLRYYTERNYLLSLEDLKTANSTLLVLKLSHKNDMTMLQLPKYTGGNRLKLDVPPIDGKRFLVGWMNFMKTFEPKWLLQIVPLKYRVLDIAFNIGPFRWPLLKFAASTPNELKQNKDIWPYPVKETGDDALLIASSNLLLLSTDVAVRVKNFGNAGLSLRLDAGITKLVEISFNAKADIKLEDSSNPLMISAKGQVKLGDVPLISGEVHVTKDTITVVGQLKVNFQGVVEFGGLVKAAYGPGLVFVLDANVDLRLLGVRLLDSRLYIKESPSTSVIQATALFMGSKISIELIRRGLSFNVRAQVNIDIHLRIDIGKISVFGQDVGRIVLSTGFNCDLKISFPGRSSLKVTFSFMRVNIQLPLLTFNTEDARPDRIPALVVDLVKREAPALIKDLFLKTPAQLLRALVKGLLDFAGNAGELIKDLLKKGFKLGANLVKDIGKFLNNLVDVEKALAKAAENAAKAAAEAARAAREAAKKVVETAKKAVKQASKAAEQAGRKAAETGKAWVGAVAKVIRLDSVLKETKRIFKNVSRTLRDVVNRIANIANKIASEIARGLRNLAGKVIKTVSGWFGKRSIYRRDALTDEKRQKERDKRKLQRNLSDQRTRVRTKERELERAKEEEQLKRNARDAARQEALRASDNLEKALKDRADKMAALDEIIKKGKCATGENNCHPNATCLRTGPDGQSFKCVCRRGWIGDGIFCEKPIKGLAIISDSPKAVGEEVSFSSFALSGTNVQYKYSFLGDFSQYGFASHNFSSPGVHVVDVVAKNNVSNSTASEVVIVQVPVSNITLNVSGDQRACRAVNLRTLANGTNVSFTIDFGDNTSLHNVTETVSHYFPRSGQFVVNVTASNLVSSSSKSFVVNISSTPCDHLYCDIWAIERIFPEKSLTQIASLAWSLAQSSEVGKRELRLNKIWKYLSLLYPVPYSVSQELDTDRMLRKLDGHYSFADSHIEIDFILAGVLSSEMENLGRSVGNESFTFNPHIQNPIQAFTWITAVLLSTDDFISTWNTSKEGTPFCKKRLSTSTFNNAIDGYILGVLISKSSENEKLSNIIHDYYCPPELNSMRYSWTSRYSAFYNLSKPLISYGNWHPMITITTLLNLTSSLEGFVSPVKDFCVPYFMKVLWSELNITMYQNKTIEESVCNIHTTCQSCLFGGTTEGCFWCEGSQKCLSNSTVAVCAQDEVFYRTPCPKTCHLNQKCIQCVSNANCGWCGSQFYEESPICTEGTPLGPRSPALCNPAKWFHETCVKSCPVNKGRLCSGKGICKTGQCLCLPGFYGKDCSQRGCVYKTKQNDTLRTLSNWLQVTEAEIRLTNIAHIGTSQVAVNTPLTLPKPPNDPNCVSSPTNARFHGLFPRILRISQNRAGIHGFCGLFGSIASESTGLSSCRGIGSKERCLKSGRCNWNIKEPCTGALLEGCFRLTHWLDLIVNELQVIHSPIPGNVKIKGDSIEITGWPKSEWEDFVVTVSHFKPHNITSVQSGQSIGTALSNENPILPNFVSVSVAQDGAYKDPLAYLIPCSLGCSQVVHFNNGICDPACNTESCNYDNGECISFYSNQSAFGLEPESIHDIYSVSSLNIFFHLQKITGEKHIIITRGPLSVYSLAKLVVLEIFNSSDLHSTLVYREYRRRIVKFVGFLTAQNTSIEKITYLTAQKLIELQVYNVSPYGRSGSDYNIAEIKTASLQNSSNFRLGLEILTETQLLEFTLVENVSRSVTPYFHLQIPRESRDISRLSRYDPTLQTAPECDSLTSCSGHGVCLANGSCKCDLAYTGLKCQMNTCPSRCSGHGTCIEGVCVCNLGWDGDDCSKVKLCTPLCPESWIGDGVCDPDCNMPKCLSDKGDCQNVCICPSAWLGDGSCDQMCNNTVCTYDGGDCVEEECSPGCRPKMLADGFCDHQCNTELCGLDKGDCGIVSNCTCSKHLQGNGMCDKECNVADCLYDYGDCAQKVTGENCPKACSPPMIGNGFCEISCNVSACNFDGGDCKPTALTTELCFEGCLPSFRGDGVCDSACNVQACGFDNGDCPKPVVQECSPGCRLGMVADGTCQSQCDVEECSFDGSDCQCAPDCRNDTLGDKTCNVECFVESCDYDGMDCLCSSKTCPKSSIGNGQCDIECNNIICGFDGGDCICSAGCSVTSVNDGTCDQACDTKLCDFDGLDCGGCESESHLNICDENAFCIVQNKSSPFLQCQCKSGYYGDGFSCVKRGNCYNGSEICSMHARCIESNGTFECHCNPGWAGNGIFCENVHECKEGSHNCSVNSKCIDQPGGYKCECKSGWTGNGYNCTDINECELKNHSCYENEDCVNTEGNYTCVCKQGWREIENASTPEIVEKFPSNTSSLCVDVDECTEEIHNCSTYKGEANAICSNSIGGFECTCTQGWQGDGYYCTDVDECANDTVCGVNQICRNVPGNYSCVCKEGWTFSGPENDECQDLDECTLGLDDCDTFATCTNTNGSFTCECLQGFEDKGRVCTEYQCSNHTNNASKANSNATSQSLCACIGSYSNAGRKCEDIDECKWGMFNCPLSAPVCQNLVGGYECKCDAVDNSSCDAVNPCESGNDTCNENMTCIAVGMKHYCVCPQGYTEDRNGTACIDINECINPQIYGSCDTNADCVNFIGGFECKCRLGFLQSGDACFEIDECEGTIKQMVEGRLEECKPGVCSNVETCVYRNVSNNGSNVNNTTLVCACEEANNQQIDCIEAIVDVIQTGKNVTTVISIPWYLAVNTSLNASVSNQSKYVHNCTNRTTCKNTAGSYECACLEGYERDDVEWDCHDTDECLVHNTCHSNATCYNTVGSFYCECKSGFTGNGIQNCSDVDECSLKTANCTHNSFCVNTVGGFICACLDGYHRNRTLLCEDLDECSSSDLNQCHPRASCHNYIGGYNCSCITGYSGNGFKCSDIDECRVDSIPCGEQATCYNTLGSYKCKCNPGWTGDGQNCANIDECFLGLHTCVENSYCADNQGSYTCSCFKGWKRQWFEPYGRCSRCDPTTFCSGHGQCLRNGTCDCLSYYGGQNCSMCRPDVRCSGHGRCDFNGSCYCDQGWTRQPLDCSICLPEMLCSGHGTCNYDLMTYENQSCFCNDEYFGYNCSQG